MNTEILSVYDVVHYLKRTLDQDIHLQSILIQGEISNFTNHRSGHWYFTLKDKKAKISCVMFSSYASRCKLSLREGMKVIVKAGVSMYEAGGSLQLYVTNVQIDGLGDLYLQLEEVKRRMAAEGLFSSQRKKPLPLYPMSIGIITAKTGAAVQDILTTIARRWPLAAVRVYPALVQGVNAAKDIIAHLREADQHDHEVLLLARGGGAIEDLWCFNDEALARCIVSLHTVVVSGVGHESDTTLVDYVSDARAPTPTAAAELITPDRLEVSASLRHIKNQLCQLMNARLHTQRQHMMTLRQHRYLQDPLSYIRESQLTLAMKVQELGVVEKRLQQYRHDWNLHTQRLMHAAYHQTQDKQIALHNESHLLYTSMKQYQYEQRMTWKKQLSLLDAYSPLKILQRGYAIVEQEEHLIKSITDARMDTDIRIRLRDGFLHASPKKKEKF